MIPNWTAEKANKLRKDLMDYFNEQADENGYLTFNASNFAHNYGVDPSTIHKIMKTFGEKKMIEYVRSGYGTIVKVCDAYRKKPLVTVENKPIVVDEKPKQVRVCRRCGSPAHNEESRFCWLCGDALFTAKELLQERCKNHMPKMCKAINDATICNETMELFGELMRIAFADEK